MQIEQQQSNKRHQIGGGCVKQDTEQDKTKKSHT